MELDNLKKDLQNLPNQVNLIIREKEKDSFSRSLKNFAQAVEETSGGKITLNSSDDYSRVPGVPCLSLYKGAKGSVHYLAVPEGYELPPFIQALKFTARGEAPLSEKIKEKINQVTTPADLKVFVSPLCTNCPKVVEVVIKLAAVNSLLSVSIIDIAHFKKMAEQYSLKSVPATIIDDDLVIIGVLTVERLAELLAQRGTAAYERERVRSLLESGLSSKVADLIVIGKESETLVTLFKEGDFFTRMGVLVAFEEALEKNPEPVKKMVPQLIELLSHEDHRIRGDIADLLGKVGDPRSIPHLERLTSDPHPEVVEAAEEALETVRSKK